MTAIPVIQDPPVSVLDTIEWQLRDGTHPRKIALFAGAVPPQWRPKKPFDTTWAYLAGYWIMA